MASDRELVQSLKNAAEALIRRTLTKDEATRLIQLFNDASGANYERAQTALQEFCRVTRVQLLEKTAASDNSDRLMRELETVAKSWKPGT